MLDVRASVKGAIYLWDGAVLMTYVKSKREMKIPAAKIKIYADSDLSKLFLKGAFLYSRNKRWDELVALIVLIGGDHAFHYDLNLGYLDSSVKMTEKEMMNI